MYHVKENVQDWFMLTCVSVSHLCYVYLFSLFYHQINQEAINKRYICHERPFNYQGEGVVVFSQKRICRQIIQNQYYCEHSSLRYTPRSPHLSNLNSIIKTLLSIPTKNERDPPLFTGKLLITFQNILRNTTQVIIRHRVKILFSVIS